MLINSYFMKKNLLLLVAFITVFAGCHIIPDVPKPETPVADRKLSFHCNIHNLTYRFSQYKDDKYKDLKMPCPICYNDSATAFILKHDFGKMELLCPIDSTWNSFQAGLNINYFLLRDKKPFFPIVPTLQDFKGYTLAQLNVWVTFNMVIDFQRFPDCWCTACYLKARSGAIQQKQDSITAYRNNINSIIGMNFTSYPINTGVPPDRRARALVILDSIENIMPTLNSNYKKDYSSINRFVGYFNSARQRYIYSQKTGTAIDSYVSEDIAFNKISADEYISDTVVINIGGGPDYSLDGSGLTIPLYKPKSSYNIQSVKAIKAPGSKNLSNGIKKSNRSKAESQYQLSTDFFPGNVDFFPNQYLPRKYNTYTTSEFIIFHPQKGNQLTSKNTFYTWNFIDLAKTVGGYDKKFPYNISSVYNAELLNDVGTMEIRKVVEWCKARRKHIVIMGTSWGAAMIFNYLLYYPSTDFDQIVIADQNPNIPASIVEGYLQDFIYGGTALTYGNDPAYKQINVNMCLISADSYRRLPWLKNQNLSNTSFYFSDTDTNVGTIPTEDISTLKSQGAKVYSFPSPISHGVFHDYRAWYRYVTPTQL